MNDESRIEEIKMRVRGAAGGSYYHVDVPWLLAVIDRLQRLIHDLTRGTNANVKSAPTGLVSSNSKMVTKTPPTRTDDDL